MPAKLIDLTGKKFGRWLVLERVKNKKDRVAYLCRCDCGHERIVLAGNLRKNSRSCGCLQRLQLAKRSLRHGHATSTVNSPEYMTWAGLHNRCSNSKDRCYLNYGARGIKVCKRWSKFENFLSDMGLRPSNEHSIDRIDNDGDYSPENCKWSTRIEQANNKRNNVLIEYDGLTLTLAQWCRRLGLIRRIVYWRINKGWSAERAFNEKVRIKRR